MVETKSIPVEEENSMSVREAKDIGTTDRDRETEQSSEFFVWCGCPECGFCKSRRLIPDAFVARDESAKRPISARGTNGQAS